MEERKSKGCEERNKEMHLVFSILDVLLRTVLLRFRNTMLHPSSWWPVWYDTKVSEDRAPITFKIICFKVISKHLPGGTV
jgi:hypothetical protein